MRKFYFLSCLAIIPFLHSCTEGNVSPEASLEGSWKTQSIEYNMDYTDESPSTGSVDYSSENAVLSFNADGSFTSNVESNELNETGVIPGKKGTYSVNGNELTLNYSQDEYNFQIFYTYKVENGDLYLSLDKALYIKTLRAQLQAQAELFAFLGLTVDEVITELENSLEIFEVKVKLTKV